MCFSHLCRTSNCLCPGHAPDWQLLYQSASLPSGGLMPLAALCWLWWWWHHHWTRPPPFRSFRATAVCIATFHELCGTCCQPNECPHQIPVASADSAKLSPPSWRELRLLDMRFLRGESFGFITEVGSISSNNIAAQQPSSLQCCSWKSINTSWYL
jgi:hypothetical protein